MQLDISEKFAAACSPVIDSNYDTCGTVTLATIDHLSVTDLNDLFTPGGKFADLEAWFFHSIEMKACGTRLYAWYDWIMANADRSTFSTNFKTAVIPGSKAAKGPGLLQPWIIGRQETIVNRDYWKMENSIRIADYTPAQTSTAIGTMTAGPLAATTGGTAVVRISNRHNIPLDKNWFRIRDVIHVFTTTSSTWQLGNWRVIDAEVDDSNTYIDVLVTGENAASTTPSFNLASTGASGKTGLIVPGINNVNDFEKWCQNKPNVDPRKRVPFWYQTRRSTRCVDEEYLTVYKRLLTANPAFREFGDLDMAERNAQDELDDQKRFVNAFFFQKPISTNQTLALWESLEDISTVTEVDLKPGLGGRLKAKRANWIGVEEQLRVCDRVKDLLGNPLNLLEFFDINYELYRNRKSQNRVVKSIDWFTNARYRAAFHSAMMQYYSDFYKGQLHFNVQVGKETQLGMIYDSYTVEFPGACAINIVSDEFFDDWRDENADLGQETVGNMLLALDIGKPGTGSIYYAMLAANRKRFTTASIEQLAKLDATFRCVMEVSSQEQTLNSETGLVIVDCPKNSWWLNGVGTAAPVTTGRTLSYTNLYGAGISAILAGVTVGSWLVKSAIGLFC